MNSYDPSYYYMPPILCDYCESTNHDAHTCPHHAYVDATCASLEKKINEMTDQLLHGLNILTKIGRLRVSLILV